MLTGSADALDSALGSERATSVAGVLGSAGLTDSTGLTSALADELSAIATEGNVWQAEISATSETILHLDILFMNHPFLSSSHSSHPEHFLRQTKLLLKKPNRTDWATETTLYQSIFGEQKFLYSPA